VPFFVLQHRQYFDTTSSRAGAGSVLSLHFVLNIRNGFYLHPLRSGRIHGAVQVRPSRTFFRSTIKEGSTARSQPEYQVDPKRSPAGDHPVTPASRQQLHPGHARAVNTTRSGNDRDRMTTRHPPVSSRHEQMIPRSGQRHIQQPLLLSPFLLPLLFPQRQKHGALGHLVIRSRIRDPDATISGLSPIMIGGYFRGKTCPCPVRRQSGTPALGRMHGHDVDSILCKRVKRASPSARPRPSPSGDRREVGECVQPGFLAFLAMATSFSMLARICSPAGALHRRCRPRIRKDPAEQCDQPTWPGTAART